MENYTFIKVEALNNEDNNSSLELLACRVCLATDSKLFDLHTNQLADVFGDLTGTRVSKTDGLPQHICNICCALMHKSAAFRANSRKVHVLLQDARVRQPLMTTDYIKTIDRTRFKLQLTFTQALKLEYTPETDDYKNDESDEQNPLVKSEPVTEFSIDDSNDCIESDDINYEFIEIPQSLPEDVDEIVKSITEELESEIYEKEPRKEEIKAKKKIGKTSPRKKKQPPKKLEEKVKVKKVREKKIKRPCNRKYEEDFVSFAETYNCEVIFLTKEQQLKEVQDKALSENYLKARYKCNYCYKGFMNVNAHEKHMSSHDKASGDHVCEICQVRFKTRKLMNIHRLRLHSYSFICKTCDHVSKVSTLAKAHFKWHEGFKYECKDCYKQFNVSSTYMNHRRAFHAAITCDQCCETVCGTRGMEEHQKKNHSTEKFPCERCNKQFESLEAYNRHLSEDGICLIYCPCTKCGENFRNRTLLYEHMENVHNETLYRCEECSLAYPTGRDLAAHWARAHCLNRQANQTYMCEICAKSYNSKLLLKNHQTIHTGEKPYQCPMCPKNFRQKIHLNVHINTHTGERPFKCKLCEQTFKSYSQRHKHGLMVHKKERRHKCHMCEKTYVVSFDLKMHIRTFHMKIPLPPPNRRKNRNKQAGNK